ncbi:MAG: glycerol-3-phosphate 1-O-acyltransferase PlsY [bacterium]
MSLLTGLLFGSIPFGYLAGIINRINIRKTGSGNIGFSNVQRVLGLGWAIPVLILDIAKGVLPVILAPGLSLVPAMAGLGAVLGHIFSPWLGFKGGKGVATTIGVAVFLCPRSLLVAIAVFLLILLVAGYVSVSSLSLALILPALTPVFYPANPRVFVFTVIVSALIIIRHIPNIKRLLKRNEPRFGLWLKLFRKPI